MGGSRTAPFHLAAKAGQLGQESLGGRSRRSFQVEERHCLRAGCGLIPRWGCTWTALLESLASIARKGASSRFRPRSALMACQACPTDSRTERTALGSRFGSRAGLYGQGLLHKHLFT